ncbi:ionotropic receptor 75a-like [Rhodnius prolixus]|uniref:Uncharacterized protein n=1 Tax=Rhodnius prolixus TaxID=13249 RepID=A0A0H2UI60_RHOPR
MKVKDFLFAIISVVYWLDSFGTGLPSSIPHIISKHFLEIQGFQLYVCEKRDATKIMRAFYNKPRLLSSKLLTTANSTRDTQLHFMQPPVLGIFVDLSCEKGIRFLNESSTKFNASYNWLFWTTNYNYLLTLLRPTRVRTDSNVTIALSGAGDTIRLLDLFRMHISLPFTVTEVELWYSNGTYIHLKDPPERKNFQRAVIPATLLLTSMDYDLNNSIDPLLDQAYMTGVDGAQRYGMSTFLTIADVFNITYSYTMAKSWGYPQKDGSWNGMMKHLDSGISEVGFGPAQLNFGRAPIIDYLMTFYLFKCTFTFKQPKLFGSYKALIVPINNNAWICIFIVVILGAIILRTMTVHDKSEYTNDNWSGSTFLVLAALSIQGMPDNPDKNPTRLFYFFFLFFTYFIFLYYGISILNGLLLPAPNAIQNMDQLLESDIRIGIQDLPYFHFELENWNDTWTVGVRKKLQALKPPHKTFYGTVEGLQEIKKGHFALYNFAGQFYDRVPEVLTNAEIASLTEIEKFRPRHTGALVMDNCPYKEIFKRKLLFMREVGIIDRERTYWMPRKPYANWELDALSIGIKPLSLAYGIIIMGAFIAIVFWLAEMLICKRRKSRNNLLTRPRIAFT